MAARRKVDMREFWDERAREDPFFFVDNRLAYGDPDLDRFWAGGREDVEGLLAAVEVEIDPEASIVEIGCGVGRLTRVLAARGRDVRALDVSERMLSLAREHNPGLDNVEWILGDGASLSGVASASADVCFSHVVFQHIPDPAITLGYVAEIGRVLRPGGWAAFQVSSEPGVHRPRPLGQRLRNAAASRRGRAPMGQAHPAWLGSAISLDRLRATGLDAGLETERVVGAGTQWCVVLMRKAATRTQAETE